MYSTTPPHRLNNVSEQIMGQRAGNGHLLEFYAESLRLVRPDPDGEIPLRAQFFQEDYPMLGHQTDLDSGNLDLNHLSPSPHARGENEGLRSLYHDFTG